MAHSLIQVADDFWNIRGSFRIAGVLDVGTQASLVRRPGGGFVLLDAYTFRDEVAAYVDEVTDGGAAIEAVLNLHPFHTIHVEAVHQRYPRARLVGTPRHRARLPDLPWDELGTESPALHAEFADALEFSVPLGVDFISDDEHVHFASVLAFHRASGTIHSDDTFNYLGRSAVLRLAGMADTVSFHPTLAKALEPRAGAAQAFRDWAGMLIADWKGAKNLCAAHTAALLEEENTGAPLHQRLQAALEKVEPTLVKHEQKHG